MLKQRIVDFIDQNHLLSPMGRYLVALSGGADSVALLLLLSELGYHVEAVHCNFRLRGTESDRDEAFCISLCRQHNIEIHLAHFDTQTYAATHKISIEMAARELRYQYFEQLRKDMGFDGVCVAHHGDDQAETVLLNLVRGTGLQGLTGMAPRNGCILRPLLDVGRADIEAWLAARNQPFVTDSTNLVADVKRNKLRLQIIPLLKELNPSVSDSIAKTARLLQEAQNMALSAVPKATKETASELELSIPDILHSASPLYSLHHYLKNYGFLSAQIEQMAARLASMESGRVFASATHQLLIDRQRILVEPLRERQRPFKIPETGKYFLAEQLCVSVEKLDKTADFKMETAENVCLLDASKTAFPLTIRPVEHGDRFVPLGMKGSKLVSDFLTDRKLTLFEKQRQLVVTDASGDIVWVVNQRPSEKKKITDDTQGIIRVEFKN